MDYEKAIKGLQKSNTQLSKKLAVISAGQIVLEQDSDILRGELVSISKEIMDTMFEYMVLMEHFKEHFISQEERIRTLEEKVLTFDAIEESR